MKQHPIGIIDSGIGGLSIWKEIVALLPNESTIYLADAKNLPYGNKPEEAVYILAKRLVQYLIDREVKLIVIACNTITVSALDKLRADFPQVPLIGTVPVIKTAVAISKTGNIGVLSTIRTAESDYQEKLLVEFALDSEVINIGTNLLVPMVESGVIDEKLLRDELYAFREAHIDTLALGCTHFPFLKNQIQNILGNNVHILDSGEAVARQVKRVMERESIESSGSIGASEFLTTGDKKIFSAQIERLVGKRADDTIQEIIL